VIPIFRVGNKSLGEIYAGTEEIDDELFGFLKHTIGLIFFRGDRMARL